MRAKPMLVNLLGRLAVEIVPRANMHGARLGKAILAAAD